MSAVATVDRKPKLTMVEWLKFVAVRKDLALRGPRRGKNPFTKEPTVHYPEPGEVNFRINGRSVAAIEFDEESGQVVISGPESGHQAVATRRFVQAMARELRGKVTWLKSLRHIKSRAPRG